MAQNGLAVLGIGNRLMGDDGVGVIVARNLRRQLAGVRVVDAGTPGYGLIDMIASTRLTVFIDAVDAGLAPGSVFWVEPDTIMRRGQHQSLHQIGLADVLALLEISGRQANVRIIGIQPYLVGAAPGISDVLRRRLPVITARAAEMITSIVAGTHGEKGKAKSGKIKWREE